MTNDVESLSRTTVALHWLVAGGVIGMLVFGAAISSMPSGPDKTAVIQIHKSCGVLVGALALARLLWRVREGFPRPAAPVKAWEQNAARGVHLLLLLVTVAMPVTGILKSITYARPVNVFGLEIIPVLLDEKNPALNEMATMAHAGMALALAALLVVHIAGALKRHLVQRDATLRRMSPLRALKRAAV